MKILGLISLAMFMVLPICAQTSKNNNVIKDLRKVNAQLNSIKDSNRELQKLVSSQESQIERLNRELSEVKSDSKMLSNSANSSITSFSHENSKMSTQVDELANSINRNSLLLISLCSALAISGIAGFLYLMRRKQTNLGINETTVDKTLSENDRNRMAEENARDTELLEVLTRTYSLLQERAKIDGNISELVDHSLPLKVGDEIHRMRKRIEHMPQEVKGLGALKNSLNRLEEEINEAGYVMVDLMGRDYNDGIMCEARFVEDPTVPPGRELITDVLKPQINHNGQVIQVAKIEVGKSYE